MKRILLFSFAVSVLSGIILLGNFIVYEALILAFGVTSLSSSFILACVLTSFSLGFILVSIVSAWYYNFLTRFLYKILATWMGFFVYFFLASVIFGIIVGIDDLVSPGAAHASFGFTLFSMAFLAGLYGLIHARRIIINKIEPNISVPESWKGKTAVFVSDFHLGQVYGISFVRQVVRTIEFLNPDIVFIGGDLYDGTTVPTEKIIEPLTLLRPALGIYFVSGNHEEFRDSSKFFSSIRSAGIEILDDRMVVVEGLQIIGVDYHNASDTKKFREILSSLSINKNIPSILLKHEPKDLEVAQEAGISFQISGHTHRGQQWPFGIIARLLYQGFEYGLKKFKTMRVYTSSGVGTWGPPIRVGTDSEIVLITF